MYRAITLYFLENKIILTDKPAIQQALGNIHLSFRNNPDTGASDIYLNGRNVATAIREMPVSNAVSDVAAIGEVRIFAVAQQQKMGGDKGLVMDGRDIGTTVFPRAELKIFMTASIDIRVNRRWNELQAQGQHFTKEEVRANLEKRDYIDSHREISPLRQAADARVLDNTELTMAQQLTIAYDWATSLIEN